MKINKTTLIICGSEDTVTPLLQAEFMKGGIAGAKLIIIENAGHLSNIEQPDAFNQIVQNYLDKLDN
jgi:pimeloyl-ACP methyl ester carboxylesterase